MFFWMGAVLFGSAENHVPRGTVGVVAEVMQVARSDLDRAVSEPGLHRRERHALDEPFARRGVAEVVERAAPPDCIPVRRAHE